MKLKTLLWFLGIFFFAIVLIQAAHAEDIISNRTGTIKITRPDGTVLTVGKDRPLPDIPSGSTVELLSGNMVVAPKAGFIQVVVGKSVATVGAGDKIAVSIDRRTKTADFKVNTGRINVITGNTTTAIKRGQEAWIDMDERTGIVEVKSIKGVIETVTVGVKASIPEGASASISADAETRVVSVKSKEGTIQVTSIDGKTVVLAKGESTDMPALVVGEIQSFIEDAMKSPLSMVDEPAEPARGEGSRYNPQ